MNRLGVTNKKLSETSKVRPNTITELNKGSVKRIDVETMDKLLNALNDIATERELGIRFTISDILSYEYQKS
ncbi:hypothetical protein D3C73_1638220 [compost metagenome]